MCFLVAVLRRLRVVDVGAKLVKEEDVEAVGCLDQVDEILPQLRVVAQSIQLGGDNWVGSSVRLA